ncbi:MAG TPA: ABC transporter ATP-binding protein [Acidimicrobiales bacterium]|nr:ABC transporter ATP-binding protein [Acidimicrobiales bacterium]
MPNAAPGGSPTAIQVEHLIKSFGATMVLRDVSLDVAPGTTVALLGPSGCGKTTLLRTIAGLESADAGIVRIGDETVVGPDTFVPPERRRIGMVFQDWALFPHLSVGANVGYGLSRDERRSGRVEESLELVGLGGFADRLPSTLSGGQQQRVALARAIAPRPRAILLDEPFSNLDTALRVQVRGEVHALLADLGVTTVFVTHDQEEAFVLGDEVAVMTAGRIVQRATPAELYDAPVDRWVATFVGEANLVDGRADGARADTGIGVVPLRHDGHGAVDVLLRPEQVHLDVGDDATVRVVEFYGHDSVSVVRLDDGIELRVRSAGPPRFRRGDRVGVRHHGPPAVAFPHEAGATSTGAAGSVPVEASAAR